MGHPIPVRIESFGYLHAPAPTATITADVRKVLRDPHVNPALRELTGHDERVRGAVLAMPGATGLMAHLTVLALGLLRTGRPFSLAIGCAGGRHRSVVIATDVAARLRLAGLAVELHHRDAHRPVVNRPTRKDS